MDEVSVLTEYLAQRRAGLLNGRQCMWEVYCRAFRRPSFARMCTSQQRGRGEGGAIICRERRICYTHPLYYRHLVSPEGGREE